MNYPPIVEGHPQLQLLRWTFQPIEYLENCAQRYGDCFAARIGSAGPPVIFVSHPEGVAEIFAPGNSSLLDSGRGQVILKLVLGSYSTILLDGREHRRHRQLLMPSFHGERMRAYGDTIVAITEQMTQSWQPGRRIRMLPTMNEITLQVILKTIFGLQGTDRCKELSWHIRRFLNTFTSPLLYVVALVPFLHKDWGAWSPTGRFIRMLRELDDLLLKEIRDRREHLDPNATDVLTMLLQARDEAGEPMTDQELRDELLSLLFAGHDSSASTFSWMFYWVHANPRVREKLLAELADLGSEPEPTEMVQLPYLNAVCSESLRLRSAVPAGSPRLVNKTIHIQGYELPPDTIIVPSQHLTHHRPDLYPDPYQFNPDRFLNNRYLPTEYYPFGGGARRCVGAAFASFEMRLILGTILRRYDLSLVDKKQPRTVRRGVNMAPGRGVRMVVNATRTPSKSTPVAITC